MKRNITVDEKNIIAKLTDDPSSVGNIMDRRRTPRIYEAFPIMIRAVDAKGEAFQLDATVDNVSAGGLYVRLGRMVERGAKMFMVIRLSADSNGCAQAMRVAALCIARRVEPQPDGRYGLAVEFVRYRAL